MPPVTSPNSANTPPQWPTGGATGCACTVAATPLADGDVSLHVDQTADQTTLTFEPWGTCTARTTDGQLMLRIDAPDEQSMQRLQDIITRNVERFGRREQLTLAWRRAEE